MTEAANAAPERTMTLYKFTNKADSPYLDGVLTMFYEGTIANKVGIMEAWSLADEEEHLILVGVEADENGKPVCFPIAKCLRAEDVSNYLAPDGKGGYYDPADPAAAEEARAEMKSIVEATVE